MHMAQFTIIRMAQYTFPTSKCFHFHTENAYSYKKAVSEIKDVFKLHFQNDVCVCVCVC